MGSRQLLCGAQPCAPPECVGKPFRLMDLPPELRLMVYEKLTIEWNHHDVPLDKDCQRKITVINPSLSGVRILATSRLVNEEAGRILKPKLAQMLASPPTLKIDIEDLPGILPMERAFFDHRNILAKILFVMRSSLTPTNLHRYRDGKGTIFFSSLRSHLLLDTFVPDDATKAVASFLLRALKFKTSNYETPNSHPPIALAITVGPLFAQLQVTYTATLPMRLLTRIFFRRSLPAIQTFHADARTLVMQLAREMSLTCSVLKTMSLCVMLHLPSDTCYYSYPDRLKADFELACVTGAQAWSRSSTRLLLNYGGLYHEADDGSPM
jgi:hypothetical protein